MTSELTTAIEDWFKQHQGDGEFAYEPRSTPHVLIGPGSHTKWFILSTKPQGVAAAIQKSERPEQFALLGRYGLPQADDLTWIRKLLKNHKVCFIGDLDPPDLLIYLWWCAKLRPQKVVHWGINDELLKQLAIPVARNNTVSLTPSEQEAVSFLWQLRPGIAKVTGEECALLLTHGRKMELDAVLTNVVSPELVLIGLV